MDHRLGLGTLALRILMPPSLITSELTMKKITLQSMISEWHNYLGMITALKRTIQKSFLCIGGSKMNGGSKYPG